MEKRIRRLLLLTAVLLSACTSTYRGAGTEGQPTASMAVLENNNETVTNIIEVDGRHRGNDLFTRYELTPGEHTIKVALYTGIGTQGDAPTIGLRVVAGETYELLYERHNLGSQKISWRPYVVNKRTRKHVEFAVPRSGN
jgi:predicted small secreted protein